MIKRRQVKTKVMPYNFDDGFIFMTSMGSSCEYYDSVYGAIIEKNNMVKILWLKECEIGDISYSISDTKKNLLNGVWVNIEDIEIPLTREQLIAKSEISNILNKIKNEHKGE